MGQGFCKRPEVMPGARTPQCLEHIYVLLLMRRKKAPSLSAKTKPGVLQGEKIGMLDRYLRCLGVFCLSLSLK